MPQAEGRLVGGRYHLEEPIGRGGMGVVWRAHDQLLDRAVAVKEVRYDSAMGDELSDLNRRTMREARAAGRLTHPNVVVVHDVIEEDGRPWIIMQLVTSRSLGQTIREDGPLSPERTAEIGLQILDALRAAHAQGVLHRDVKPENVLLTEDGRVVLTDFGIARLEADSTMTRTGIVGTPAFIPPERLRGGPAQRESDLWSLGATLYTAVEGKPPHDRGMAMATMHAVLTDDPTPAIRAGRLGPVLIRLLAREPEDRPGYDEIVRLLKDASRPAPVAPSPTLPEVVPPSGPVAEAVPAPPRPPAKKASPPEAAPGPAAPPDAPPADEEAGTAPTEPPASGADRAPAPGEGAAPEDKEPESTPGPGKATSTRSSAESEDPPASEEMPLTRAVPRGTPETGSRAAAPARPTPPARPAPSADPAPSPSRAPERSPAPRAAPPGTSPSRGAPPPQGPPSSFPVQAHEPVPAPDPTRRAVPPRETVEGRLNQTPPRQWPEPAAADWGGRPGWGRPAPAPTQRGTGWQAGGPDGLATARAERWRPSPLVKWALVVIPALLIVAAIAGYLGIREGERTSGRPVREGREASPSASGRTTPPSSPSTTPSASGKPTPAASQPAGVPDGWRRYKDKTGFSIALPNGWKVDRRDSSNVWFRGPDRVATLQIGMTSTPKSDAVKDWESQERSAPSRFPGYQRVRITSVDYFKEAADWEFTWRSGNGRRHAINRGFVTDSHHGYAIFWHTPDSRWQKDLHYFRTFTTTFKPAT
jgi:serine/threonine protein kinase